MKKIYLLLLALTISWFGFGQITEGFESAPSSYTTGSIVLGSGTWTGTNVIRGTTGVNSGLYSCQLQSATGSQITSPSLSNGVGTISFYITASTTSGAYQVNVSSDNGATFSPASGSPFTIGQTKTLRTITVNNSAVNKIQIYRTGATIYIDDFSTTTAAPCSTPVNVTAFTPTAGNQQVALNWTNSACFDDVLVVAKAASSVTAVPTGNGSAYTANAAFGSGTAIATGEFVVYKGIAATTTTTALTNGTTYHFKVFTRKGTVWSSGVVANATPALVYCTANGTTTFQTSITLVNFANINNVTAKPAGYNNYLAQSANVNRGTNVPLNIRLNTDGNYNVYSYVFIDWNQNGVFTDAGETYDLGLVNNNANGLTSLSPKSITIPNTATLGSTRMRVVCQYYLTTPPVANSCATGIDGEVEDYTVSVAPPINYTYNNGWSPSDPNGQSTSLNNITIANGAAVISSSIGANTVTVNPTGALTVNTGNTLTVSNGLNLQSNSTQYSSLISNGTITGTVNYTRHVNAGSVAGVGGNDLISAPLSGQAFNLFKQANGNIKTNTAATLNLFGPFAKPGNVFLTYANGDTFPMTAGEGHRAASTDNDGFIFTGTVNTGTVSRSIETSGSGGFAPWNLIGNPYPSYLYVKEQTGAGAHDGFLSTNVSQFAPNYAAIYGYKNEPTGGNYTVWNLANTTSTTSMTPGQGFFVVSNTGTNSVSFTASMRAIGTTDDFILGREANDENNASIRLRLANDSESFVTDFYFNDASTLGLDPGYDAGIFGGSAPAFSIFSQLVEDNAGVNMAIQSLPYSSLGSEVVVPVGLRVSEGQQVTISSENNTIPSSVDVYLEDTVANTSTLITNSDYVFTTPSNLNGVGRFYLRFTNTTLSTPETTLNGLQIYSTATPRTLYIKGQLSTATTVSLIDIQGRTVLTTALDTNSNSNQVDVSNLSSGVYVVKLSNSAQQKTQKVILK